MGDDRVDPEYWEAVLASEGMPSEPRHKRDGEGKVRELPFAPEMLFLGEPLVDDESEEWLHDLVVDAIEALPEPHRQCLELHTYGRMGVRGIAAEVGMTRNPVAITIREAKAKVKAILLQDPRLVRKYFGYRPGKAGCPNRTMECGAGACERPTCPECDCIPGSLAEIGAGQETGSGVVLLDDPRPRGA